ncbi:hypothetical protein D9611_009453 [Ephemerocybe angulata]|uniref:F-box domain-containing protein n=1 Tax=Ephemerocybe angulata TaxID=980116 RepID=A0A8H5AW88_9AGAR|nr:hypothetical protein D9611_009453 [Tulosesus angulatus]
MATNPLLPPQKGDLPNDLWFEIATLIEPSDLLTLKAVCKVFHDFFAERELWVYVLYALCHRHCLFIPSYPIDDMTTMELQRAALGPRRWEELLNANGSPVADIRKMSMLRPVNMREHYTLGANTGSKHFLVPGGRFLVTATFDSVTLWDLGAVGRTPLSPPLKIASATVGTRALKTELATEALELTVVPVDGTTLRVAVALRGKSQTLFEVFDISPGRKGASLSSIGVLSAESRIETYPRFRNLLIHGNILHASLTRFDISLVWDFSINRYILGPLRDGPVLLEIPRKAFIGSSIIEFGKDSLHLWPVSLTDGVAGEVILGSAVDLDADLHRIMEGKQEFPYPTWRGMARVMTTVHIPPTWQSGNSVFPLTFDIIRDTWADVPADDAATGYRYQLDIIGKANHTEITNQPKLDVSFKLVATFDFPPGFSYTPLMDSAPSAVQGAQGNSASIMMKLSTPRRLSRNPTETMYAMYTLPFPGHSPTTKLRALTTPIRRSDAHPPPPRPPPGQWPASEPEAAHHCVCSASGRLVFTTWLNDIPVSTIVSDFLSPWIDMS